MDPAIDAVELTRELLAFDTINPPGQEAACARHLGAIFEAASFAVCYRDFAPDRTSLVAHYAGNGPGAPLCFAGHMDTVPLGGTPWSVDPFAGEIRDGRLYGRGSSDMKSGVAAMVTAAVRIAQLQDTGGLTVVIVSGEETGCEGSFDLAALPEELGKAGAMVVAEPTGNYPLVGHKGAFWLRGSTAGITAHGSMPDEGVNAVYKAAHAILALANFDFEVPPHEHLGPPTLNVGNVHGGINVNSVPDRAQFGIDIRTIPGQDHDQLLERLRGLLGDEVELEILLSVPSLWTDPDTPWVRQVCDVMTPLLGARPEVRTVAYFTDAAALTPAFGHIPTVILGPGEAAMAHKTDEYCEVRKIGQAVEAYVEIARRWYETGAMP
ncbi:MAG: M20 family metallopeptidase [Deferrisomatales bacterium]|nr:M20 family metallopeptidase [Deferrisomatales bacterium]